MSSNSYSSKYNIEKEKLLREKLEASNYEFSPIDYGFWKAKGEEVTVSLYKSGKILVQGKGTIAFTTKYLNVSNQLSLIEQGKNIHDDEKPNYESWIGTDESGKGDYFGPLIIAGVLVDENNYEKFKELGLKDSKKIKDAQILKLAPLIKANSVFSIVTINPSKYNELYDKFKNLNKLLAWGHARAIENILEKKPCQNALSDKFGDESLIKKALLQHGRNINLEQRVRAESDVAVAAASILARAEFVLRMKNMSDSYGLDLQKGANDKVIEQAKFLVAKNGNEVLKQVAKLHFKTTASI